VTLAGADERGRAIEAVERIIERESDADEVLRLSVAALVEELAPAAPWAGIAFVEEHGLALGPTAGTMPPAAQRPALAVPVDYRGSLVAEIWIGGSDEPDAADGAMLARLAELLSPYCLVGWDTGGAAWEP
jgi:hypothetical protein